MKSIEQPVLELWCGMWFAADTDAETLWEHYAPFSTTLSGGIMISYLLKHGDEWVNDWWSALSATNNIITLNIQGVPERFSFALLEICRVGGWVSVNVCLHKYWALGSGMLPRIIINQLKLIMHERHRGWTYISDQAKEERFVLQQQIYGNPI
jgi:hypothetical protein